MTAPDDAALDAAARWLARLRAPDVSAFDRRGFRRWLRASSAHLLAFEAALSLWDRLGLLLAATGNPSPGGIPGRSAAQKGEQS
jgi:ferric-dicitrate binding protein FerR (iron transport regulator)